jgi:hypothetical protein
MKTYRLTNPRSSNVVYSSKFYNSSLDLHILERCDKTEQNRSNWIQINSGSREQAIYLGNRQINHSKLWQCFTQYRCLCFHDSASPSHQDTAFSFNLSNNALPQVLHKSNMNVQGAAERTPRFGRGIASGGERVVERRCTCRFQCTPWRGRENNEPLVLRRLLKMAGRVMISGGRRVRQIWPPAIFDMYMS